MVDCIFQVTPQRIAYNLADDEQVKPHKLSDAHDFMNLIDMVVDATAKRSRGRPKGSPNVKQPTARPPKD